MTPCHVRELWEIFTETSQIVFPFNSRQKIHQTSEQSEKAVEQHKLQTKISICEIKLALKENHY